MSVKFHSTFYMYPKYNIVMSQFTNSPHNLLSLLFHLFRHKHSRRDANALKASESGSIPIAQFHTSCDSYCTGVRSTYLIFCSTAGGLYAPHVGNNTSLSGKLSP